MTWHPCPPQPDGHRFGKSALGPTPGTSRYGALMNGRAPGRVLWQSANVGNGRCRADVFEAHRLRQIPRSPRLQPWASSFLPSSSDPTTTVSPRPAPQGGRRGGCRLPRPPQHASRSRGRSSHVTEDETGTLRLCHRACNATGDGAVEVVTPRGVRGPRCSQRASTDLGRPLATSSVASHHGSNYHPSVQPVDAWSQIGGARREHIFTDRNPLVEITHLFQLAH